MYSTLKGTVPPYVGIDLTDRYSKACRDIDVCGLTPDGDNLVASFWSWEWDASHFSLDVSAIAKELKAVQAAMIDGPQALAKKGNRLRDCERRSAAAGKTPDVRPRSGKPFDNFICSSLDLFKALWKAEIQISGPGSVGGISEIYPGHIWRILAGGTLPKKSTRAGRFMRRQILQALRVSDLPALPTHDQNDACIGAVIAAAADGRCSGLSVRGIGSPLNVDEDGTLREGLMAIPEVSVELHASISTVLTYRVSGKLSKDSNGS